jgi:hypothetical protein
VQLGRALTYLASVDTEPRKLDFNELLAMLQGWFGDHIAVTVGSTLSYPMQAMWAQGTLRRTHESPEPTDAQPDREVIDFDLVMPGFEYDDDSGRGEWMPGGFRISPADFNGAVWDGRSMLTIVTTGCTLFIRHRADDNT